MSPALLVQWELPDLQEREELMGREDQVEVEECPGWRDLLELLAGKVYLADLETLESPENLGDR